MGHFLIKWLIVLCIKLGERRNKIRKANDECSAHDQYDGKSNDEAIVLLKNHLCLVFIH
jgi:hypothetical protein